MVILPIHLISSLDTECRSNNEVQNQIINGLLSCCTRLASPLDYVSADGFSTCQNRALSSGHTLEAEDAVSTEEVTRIYNRKQTGSTFRNG